jgi:hypothetical protein
MNFPDTLMFLSSLQVLVNNLTHSWSIIINSFFMSELKMTIILAHVVFGMVTLKYNTLTIPLLIVRCILVRVTGFTIFQ